MDAGWRQLAVSDGTWWLTDGGWWFVMEVAVNRRQWAVNLMVHKVHEERRLFKDWLSWRCGRYNTRISQWLTHTHPPPTPCPGTRNDSPCDQRVVVGQCFQAKKRHVTRDWSWDTTMSSSVRGDIRPFLSRSPTHGQMNSKQQNFTTVQFSSTVYMEMSVV